MLLIAMRGVRHNPARYIATLVAIITGVAFFAATGFISDRVISVLEGDVARQYGSVDAAIVADESSAEDAHVDEIRISGDAADRIFTADSVDGSAGIVTGSVAFLADDGSTFADNATGHLWIDDEELNPVEIVEGSAPAGAGQIAVDQGTADDEDLAVGDSVTLLTLAGQQQVEIVGISKFGESDAIDSGGSVYLSQEDAFNWLTSGIVEYEEIYLRSDLPQSELVTNIEGLVPGGFEIQSGEEFLQDKKDAIGAPGRILKQGLQAFAILAMLVGGFVIYNTFNVIVTQRIRELAVMAAIGATPRQIMSSLLYEGIIIGVVGSALGIVTGFALTFILVEVLKAFNISLPGSGVSISASNVTSAILLGTVITVVSVMIPARRAARTEPIEALRASAAETTTISRRRISVTLAILGLSAVALLIGSSWPIIAAGALVFFVGVIIAGPMIAVYGSRVAHPVMSIFGLEGRLAVDNTARNPQRTATTANALLIGVFLVSFVLVAGTSLKEFAVAEIKDLSSADFLISSDGGTIDDELVSSILEVDDVEVVVPFRRESVTIDGLPGFLSTGDIAELQSVAKLSASAGSLDDLGPGTIAVADTGDPTTTPAIGATVEVADNTGDTLDLEVVAIIESSLDTIATGNLVDEETFDSLVGDTAPTVAFIDVATGAHTETTDEIEDLVNLRPDITLTEGNAIGRLIGGLFDFLINAVNGLLAMSVIIALIGIINTLSLSIIERRRELGLLRAVGMTDERVKNMVRLESVVIAALGTFTGVALGLFFGWALIFTINREVDSNISLGLPLTLLLVIVLGPVLGLIASLIPAWRSTKLDVLESLQAT